MPPASTESLEEGLAAVAVLGPPTLRGEPSQWAGAVRPQSACPRRQSFKHAAVTY